MIVVYTPKDGEPEQYDATSLRVSEASIVQRTVDMKWQDILRGLEVDDLDAMRGLVWVLKKRTQPSLRFGDFDPGVGEMTTRMDKRETAAYVDSFFVQGDLNDELTPEQIADVLRSRLPDITIDPEHAQSLIDAKLTGPKDPDDETRAASSPQTPETSPSPSPTSSSAETSTSDSSPISSTSPLPESTT